MRRSTVQRSLPPMELQTLENPVSTLEGRVSTALKSVESWRALVGTALGRARVSQKVAAAEMQIAEPQLSRQLSGVEHLSFWRMKEIPAPFWQELVLLIIEFYDLQIGMTEQDRRDCETGRALRELVFRVHGR